jgi:hypothetical protein
VRAAVFYMAHAPDERSNMFGPLVAALAPSPASGDRDAHLLTHTGTSAWLTLCAAAMRCHNADNAGVCVCVVRARACVCVCVVVRAACTDQVCATARAMGAASALIVLSELVRVVALYAARPAAAQFAPSGGVAVPPVAASLPASWVRLVGRLCGTLCPTAPLLAPAIALAFVVPLMRRLALLVRAMSAADDEVDARQAVAAGDDVDALLLAIGVPSLAQFATACIGDTDALDRLVTGWVPTNSVTEVRSCTSLCAV